VFFIPECGKAFEHSKGLIEENGGMMVDQHECYTFQIKPQDALLKVRDFYWGKIYQDSWIVHGIEEAKENTGVIGGNKMIQCMDDHFLVENEKLNCRKLNISKKKNFTIMEGIKLFGLIGSNHCENLNKNSFWQNIEKNQTLPERSAEQMKKFWHRNESNTVEQWLVQAIHDRTDFSFCLKDIPSADFESNFRRKYEIEFMKLESVDPIAGPSKQYSNPSALAVSSVHSSVYSQNLGRTISVASIGQASQQEEPKPSTILKTIDVAKVNNQYNETSTSSLVRNSQNTADTKNVEFSVFNQNQYHINYVDNSLVQKVMPQEYEMTLQYHEDHPEAQVVTGTLSGLYD
jgi:hypothetical protein